MEATRRAQLGIKIRPFEMKDYDQVCLLYRLCGLPLWECQSRSQAEKKTNRDPDLFLVAEANQAILGAALGAFDGSIGWVRALGVDPRFRRLGIGTQLLQKLVENLKQRGVAQLAAVVPADNFEAQEVFQGEGFRPAEKQILMSCLLPGPKCSGP